MCNVAMPVANLRIMLVAGYVGCVYEDVAVGEGTGWLLIKERLGERPVQRSFSLSHRQIMAKTDFVGKATDRRVSGVTPKSTEPSRKSRSGGWFPPPGARRAAAILY